MKFPKRLSLVMALAAMVLCTALDSSAQLIDGHKLVADMQEFEKAERKDPDTNCQQAFFYVGYVTGVYDASDDFYPYPGKPTIKEICSLVAKYLKDNPGKWGRPADLLIIEALQKAFPKK
jgi:hypothetical protein